jgi:hypothetical protein
MELFFRDLLEEGLLKITTVETYIVYSLSHYIPECRYGSVIIITRNKKTGLRLAWGKLLIEVSNINNNKVYSLLYIILEDEKISVEEISYLLYRLEYLLLDLIQAAVFIQENRIPLSEYI